MTAPDQLAAWRALCEEDRAARAVAEAEEARPGRKDGAALAETWTRYRLARAALLAAAPVALPATLDALDRLRGSCDPYNGDRPQWCGSCSGLLEAVRPGKVQCRGCEAEREVERLRAACMAQAHEVEEALGVALSGATPADAPGPAWALETPEGLAVLAAREIARLRGEAADLEDARQHVAEAAVCSAERVALRAEIGRLREACAAPESCWEHGGSGVSWCAACREGERGRAMREEALRGAPAGSAGESAEGG